MLKLLLFTFFLSSIIISFGQKEVKSKLVDKLVTIKGAAPAYIGKKIEVYEIQDYISNTEILVASSIVKPDSTFSLTFYESKIKKAILRSNNNSSIIYIQPDGKYDVYLPEKDKYDPYRPNGNFVELSFFDLDSLDINYKILGFERWMDDFLAAYFYTKKVNGTEFNIQLDKFKTNVEKEYMSDSSFYFKTFVKFRMASLDEIQQVEEKGTDQKFDFYIKKYPVCYDNDAYMEYVMNFYEDFMLKLSFKNYNAFYLGILKSSPSLLMKSLDTEYYMVNLRIREMIMLKMLSDAYYTKDFPQSNILTIMDSVAVNPFFESNKIISINLKKRLLELVPGGRAPNFALTAADGTVKTLESYPKNHIYINFLDLSSEGNVKQFPLLIPLHLKYQKDIQFITVYKKKDSYSQADLKILASIAWDKFEIKEDDPILKTYQIVTYPSYVLLDGFGYVVQSPAYGPIPNGEGKTIDNVFFQIQKIKAEIKTEQK